MGGGGKAGGKGGRTGSLSGEGKRVCSNCVCVWAQSSWLEPPLDLPAVGRGGATGSWRRV